MPSTPAFGFRFPEPGATPDVPRDIRRLAEDVEGQALSTNAAVTAVEDSVAALDALGPKVLGTFTGGAGTNVTTIFDNIDQSYRMLQLIWRGKHDGTPNGVSLNLRFNGDGTSGNYRSFRGWAQEGAASWSIQDLQVLTTIHAGMVGGGFGSSGVLWVTEYSATSGVHTVHGSFIARGTGGSATGLLWGMGGGAWTPGSNQPVTSIQLWPLGQNWDGNVEATLTGYS